MPRRDDAKLRYSYPARAASCWPSQRGFSNGCALAINPILQPE
jgi:hypothetical protein